MATIRPEDAANILIMLYRQTNYRCDYRKLQKLVIYADIIYYQKTKKRMIESDCVTATQNGLSIEKLCTGTYQMSFNTIDERAEIVETIDKTLELPLNSLYDYKRDVVNDDQKDILCYVFKKLGAYSGDDLTSISTHTELWKKARNMAESPEQIIKVTNSMYNDFIEFVIEKMENNNDSFQTFFINFLLSLLQ